jgi:hypothetical protein
MLLFKESIGADYEQNRNRRDNVWVELNGERMIIADAIILLPVGRTQFYRYMRRYGLIHQETIDHYSIRI